MREYEEPQNDDYLDDEDAFEARLKAKLEAKSKSKSRVKKDDSVRYYLDPVELEANLREHVIMKGINPNHTMTDKLGNNVTIIVAKYGESGQFRRYYNGWKEEMHSRAREHICAYAHSYKINYTKTIEFFIRWVFRRKSHVLQSWLSARGLSYKKFYASLLEVKIPTPNGKEKSKMGRKIFESDLVKLNNPSDFALLVETEGTKFPDVPPYNEETFKEEIFELGNANIRDDFEDQVKRNPFNYLTKYAYNAFIAVIREEKEILEHTQSFEERRLYHTEGGDEDGHGVEDRYTQIDEGRFDWDYEPPV